MLLSKGPPTVIVIYKYLAFKGALDSTLMCKYPTFKGATNSNCNVPVLQYDFKGTQTATSNV